MLSLLVKVSLLGKESLNSDGQQFRQYQQDVNNHLKLLNTKRSMTYGVRNPGIGVRKAQKMCLG